MSSLPDSIINNIIMMRGKHPLVDLINSPEFHAKYVRIVLNNRKNYSICPFCLIPITNDEIEFQKIYIGRSCRYKANMCRAILAEGCITCCFTVLNYPICYWCGDSLSVCDFPNKILYKQILEKEAKIMSTW